MERIAQTSGDPKGKGRVKTSTNVSEDEEGEEGGRFLSSPPPSTEGKPRLISPPPASSSSASVARKGAVTGAGGVLCQADRCTADFTDAKRYHRRHKVCEAHSKAAVVIVSGIRQRFCQQCSRHNCYSVNCWRYESCKGCYCGLGWSNIVSSDCFLCKLSAILAFSTCPSCFRTSKWNCQGHQFRFHELSEFDDSKRSCRRRLAGHNERRRKSTSDTHQSDRNSSGEGLARCRQADPTDGNRIPLNVSSNPPPYKHFPIR